MWNPIRAIADSKRRKELKAAMLVFLRATLREPNDCIGLSGMNFTALNLPAQQAQDVGFFSVVLEELCRENPQYSVIHWKGEPAIVYTGAVDALPKDIRDINESIGFISRGGKF